MTHKEPIMGRTNISIRRSFIIDTHLIALESLAERLSRAGYGEWAKEIDTAVHGIKEATR